MSQTAGRVAAAAGFQAKCCVLPTPPPPPSHTYCVTVGAQQIEWCLGTSARPPGTGDACHWHASRCCQPATELLRPPAAPCLQCGSCYAFAATAAIESKLMIGGGRQAAASKQGSSMPPGLEG